MRKADTGTLLGLIMTAGAARGFTATSASTQTFAGGAQRRRDAAILSSGGSSKNFHSGSSASSLRNAAWMMQSKEDKSTVVATTAAASFAVATFLGGAVLCSPLPADAAASVMSTVPSSSVPLAGIEIVPAGGGGFGGLGISPFGAGPFGGFGFGFGIRSTPERGISVRAPDKQPQENTSREEMVERIKADLEATKERERQLDRAIKELSAATDAE